MPTIVFTQKEFAEIGQDAEELYGERELARHYVLLLKEPVKDAAAVEESSTDDHRAVVRGRACHLLLGSSYEAGGVDPLRVEKLVGVATNRNYKVVTALAEEVVLSHASVPDRRRHDRSPRGVLRRRGRLLGGRPGRDAVGQP